MLLQLRRYAHSSNEIAPTKLTRMLQDVFDKGQHCLWSDGLVKGVEDLDKMMMLVRWGAFRFISLQIRSQGTQESERNWARLAVDNPWLAARARRFSAKIKAVLAKHSVLKFSEIDREESLHYAEQARDCYMC